MPFPGVCLDWRCRTQQHKSFGGVVMCLAGSLPVGSDIYQDL